MAQVSASQRAERELESLRLGKEKLDEIRVAFKSELVKGLEMHKRHGLKWVPEECSFRMLDSCVSDVPTGNETGIFYALDFGGTNVRAVKCELVGGGKITSQQCLKNLHTCGGSVDLMAAETSASQLFDVLVGCITELIDEGDKERFSKTPTKLGFTFSFPCVQKGLNSSILEAWTKGFATGYSTNEPVVGQDVAQLLTEAIKRKNLGIECAAIVNDTVGTLLSCAYQKKPGSPPCRVGVILGTGANCCYIEPEAEKYGYSGTIINVECGNFDKHLPTTPYDVAIDNKSPNKGQQLLEKMISGFYLGELVRLITLQIFGDAAPAKVKEEFTLDTKHVATLASTAIPGAPVDGEVVAKCKEIIKTVWGWDVQGEVLQVIRDVSFAVFDRSAALAAISIAAMAERTGGIENGMTVAVDGSLYVKNKWYGERIMSYMKDMIGDNCNKIILNTADDGSGKGAAICVAALH